MVERKEHVPGRLTEKLRVEQTVTHSARIINLAGQSTEILLRRLPAGVDAQQPSLQVGDFIEAEAQIDLQHDVVVVDAIALIGCWRYELVLAGHVHGLPSAPAGGGLDTERCRTYDGSGSPARRIRFRFGYIRNGVNAAFQLR